MGSKASEHFQLCLVSRIVSDAELRHFLDSKLSVLAVSFWYWVMVTVPRDRKEAFPVTSKGSTIVASCDVVQKIWIVPHSSPMSILRYQKLKMVQSVCGMTMCSFGILLGPADAGDVRNRVVS